jgi:hypothetical protein
LCRYIGFDIKVEKATDIMNTMNICCMRICQEIGHFEEGYKHPMTLREDIDVSYTTEHAKISFRHIGTNTKTAV